MALHKKLYFGHPTHLYGTGIEAYLLQRIAEQFPDWEIINPNGPEHQKGYRSRGMDYFLELVRSCHAGVFLRFSNDHWGAGTFQEASALLHLGQLKVWVIDRQGNLRGISTLGLKKLDRRATRTRLKEEAVRETVEMILRWAKTQGQAQLMLQILRLVVLNRRATIQELPLVSFHPNGQREVQLTLREIEVDGEGEILPLPPIDIHVSVICPVPTQG